MSGERYGEGLGACSLKHCGHFFEWAKAFAKRSAFRSAPSYCAGCLCVLCKAALLIVIMGNVKQQVLLSDVTFTVLKRSRST